MLADSRPRRSSLVAVAALAVIGVLFAPGAIRPAVAGPVAASDVAASDVAASDVAAPAVWPVPRQQSTRGDGFPLPPRVALVAGAASDSSAVGLTRRVLAAAGVTTVVVADATAGVPDAPVVVWVGGPAENAASAAALDALGIAGPAGLPAGGYVLGIGRGADDLARIVLSGADQTGTFYAAQTLRQLVVAHAGRNWMPGVSIRDWPQATLRGVIEGFYGPPWSTADRLSQLDFLAATKQNVYVYSPKDDPYLRAQWRQPYPADQLDVIRQLVDRATADHVAFTYALSPGLSVCYSSDADERALVAKLSSMWDIGVRAFAIPLDDISYTTWNCAADQARWGSGGAAAGHAQSYLLDRVQADFIDTHPGAGRLEMVPTEYANASDSPYKAALRADLDPRVVVEWTGVGVVPATITASQAAQARVVYGHDVLVWDNYPVNDYTTDRLLLGPYTGREAGMTDHVIGVTANPMVQSEPSKIAEFTTGDYLWNPTAYDPDAAWLAALAYLGGTARAALKVFAENNRSSILDSTESPALAPLLSALWRAYDSGADLAPAARAAAAYFDAMAAAPDQLTAGMSQPPSELAPGVDGAAFLAQAGPWIDKLGGYGQAGRIAVDLLSAQRAGDGAAAWAARTALDSLRARLATMPRTVAPGVIDPFLARVVAASNRWLGVTGGVVPLTSMGSYSSYLPANMTDGDPATYYWSDAAPRAGDFAGVDLGASQQISNVDIVMAKPGSPNDYIHRGVLEYSTDGTVWTAVATVTEAPHVTASLPAGTTARYVRLRATATQPYWVVVDEFTVGVAGTLITVTGAPAPAPGSALRAAADNNPGTAYTAAGPPATGDALVATLTNPRPLDAVVVLQDAAAPAAGEVQVLGADGAWRGIGTLTGGYTQLGAGGAATGAIRVAWTAGTPVPHVYEIVPWYADTPPVALSIKPAATDVEAAGDAASTTVSLAADRIGDVDGTLSVDAPDGWQVQPGQVATTVYRGTAQTVAVSLRVPAGAAPGGYPVPVNFTPTGSGSGDPVTVTFTVNVHPRTSGTNIAPTGTATASCVEGDGAYPQFAPRYAIDGDPSTRWSSCYDDDAWLQVRLPAAATVGKVVLRWEAAYGKSYLIQTSTDGVTWTTAASVGGGDGGTDVVYLDGTPVASYLRMQGVRRALQYGYSVYEMEVYPVA